MEVRKLAGQMMYRVLVAPTQPSVGYPSWSSCAFLRAAVTVRAFDRRGTLEWD